MAYTKLFNSIITSTIWSEDDRTRIVWITLLACAGRHGEVHGSIPGLARLAGVPVEDCRSAFVKFLSPDPDSRTKDDDGRRIEEIDGGWVLINYCKYRDMMTDDDRKKQAAIRQQRARDKKSRNSHAIVTLTSLQIPHPEAEAEAEASARQPRRCRAVVRMGAGAREPSLQEWQAYAAELSPPFPPFEAERAWNHYEANGWRVGKNPVRKWQACCRTCHGRWKKESMSPDGKRPAGDPCRPEIVIQKGTEFLARERERERELFEQQTNDNS